MGKDNDIDYIITHVFLPPKLPQKDDEDVEKRTYLIEAVLAALISFQHKNDISEQQEEKDGEEEKEKCVEWSAYVKMFGTMLELRNQYEGRLEADKLGKKLREMIDGDIVALHLASQNAGLIIRRRSDGYAFESFEVSPTNEAVMSTKGRLRRCFPGPAMIIGHDRMADITFLDPLTQLLAKLDAETPQEVVPITRKAGSEMSEIRDTVDPRFVTELLTGILRAVGRPLNDVERIYKHTREDVLWKSALKPWRRSPLWLFLRVALQTSMMQTKDKKQSHERYKSFMLFFMARVLNRALKASLPSDMLFFMTAKISRRALKLGRPDATAWLRYVESITGDVHDELARRWCLVEKDPDPFGTQRAWLPSQLSLLQDAELRLSTLRPYLEKVRARSTSPLSDNPFTSDCDRRISQCSSSLPDLSLWVKGDESQDCLHLTDLERWVENHLDGWLLSNMRNGGACTALAKIIKTYASAASSNYRDMPGETSRMLLTLMDLWVALDKCALPHYPLLRDYDPEFPPSLLEPLLLPNKLQMERLAHIENYLAMRKKAAEPDSLSIFRSINEARSFSVLYFQQSPHHQLLRQKIESQATNERSSKKAELAEKRRQHHELSGKAERMSCQELTRWKKGRIITDHSPHCEKCRLEAEANDLIISVHEWPLPESNLAAKAAVFELDVPIIISEWRNTTFSLLVDFFSPINCAQNEWEKLWTLQNFIGLKPFVIMKPGLRLQLASTTKPFTYSHYSHEKVSRATEAGICVPHGCKYALHDSVRGKWAKDLLNHCDVREKCTFKLPNGQYKGLQYAVENTTHTSNEVISTQDKCPEALGMHEFYAFGTLRAGHRLQWRNIARELIARVLNFRCYETHALVVQAAWQVGPFGNEGICRESHVDLKEEDFGMSLLSALQDALGTIEGNWQGATAARTFIALAIRLMSLSTCGMVHEGCARFLRRAREISLRWTRDLSQILQGAQDEGELKNLNEQTLEMGLTCYGTFEVDPQHLPSLLESDEDAAIVTECSIIVQDRLPVLTQNLPLPIKQLLRRHWRLSSRLEPLLRKRILKARSCIDRTISRLWGGYEPGSPWTALKSPNERWVMTTTSSTGCFSSMLVHYNLLDGSLLVNGSPLTRLPRSYELHPTFLRIFGKKILDVVPSTMSGMAFEARNELFDHRVYFGMYDKELIIRAKRLEQIYELLPIHALDGDFPHAFVQDYVHWLEIKTGFVEWRPLVYAWTHTPQNWQMRPRKNNVSMLSRGCSRLIDPQTPTAKAVSTVLSPLEHANHMHIILNSQTQMLEVQLPRLKLDFFLEKGTSQLESKQFRGMCVDTKQSFGALTGLVNKLVLRGKMDSSRSVIIPHGEVKSKKEGHHVRVDIYTLAQPISYQIYSIDSRIGRLIDNGSLKSRLFKCYLHAVTAHGLIDELTGQTGTEEALSILESPSIRSSLWLEQAESELLLLLAQLTPRRLFYPKHLKVMQEVHWGPISPLAQHVSFYALVRSIFEQVRRYSLFYDTPNELPDADICGDRDLLERAVIRGSTNHIDEFGARKHTDEYDTLYVARDHIPGSIKESWAFQTATLVDNWSVNLKGCSELLQEIESWQETLRGCGSVDLFPLGYDINWLAPRTEFLPDHWCVFHSILTQAEVENDKYRIMMFLSTLAYSQHMKQELVQTFLAFATVPELRRIRLPEYESFDLAHGYTPNRRKLTELTRKWARPFSKCPEHDLPRNYDESWQEANDRRRGKHEMALDDCLDVFVGGLICQWPVANVRAPVGAQLNIYISLEEATDDARKCFQNWHQNAQFKESIGEIHMILKGLISGDQRLLGYFIPKPQYSYQPKQSHVTFGDVTSRPAPKLSQASLGNFHSWVGEQDEDRAEHQKLKSLLDRLLSESPGGFERQYAMDLLKSFDLLSGSADARLIESSNTLKQSLERYLKRCQSHVDNVYQTICHCLQEETSITRRLACRAKMWPRLSTTSLLHHLIGESASLRDDWKGCLAGYGVAISNLQRAERLLASIGNNFELLNELSNPGHQDWDPLDHPEWLLLEIENNILIRRVQTQVAREMISPSSCANSIMQLNMGEGKSSVIVPMVAAALADGQRLVRIVVLKPLSTQMFHLLLNKLGGMLGRRIFHMPISRSVRLDVHKAMEIRKLCEECMHTGGVLLVQPENLLSFELMSLERLLSDDLELGSILTETQLWLDKNSRDILDESDEILSVRFELIYTMGMQRAIEFSPDRWTIIEDILGLVSHFAQPILRLFPQGLELQTGCPGSFPRVRVLQHAAADKLLEMVAREVCERGLPGMPVWSLPQHVRTVLYRFVTDRDMSEADSKPLQRYFLGVESMWRSLLLLRGLIGGGVLAFALGQKRWRVSYGLDLSRTMLAVPYRAKDSPATRAEFGHPDATIVLTCLSYYYGGLSNDQLQTAFEKLLLSDHAQEEFERWVQDAPRLPLRFHQLTGINLSDVMQCSQKVFPPLRFAKGAIDFYLSRLVFPREMKEFPHKLSSSGWDIARVKDHPTTGFSGTNDSRYILPLSVSQCDLPPQLHTNAAVLGCLMRPENNFNHAMRESKRDSFDAESLLQLVIRSKPPVRVILDVGAQVLEWKNEEVADAWLSHVPTSDAQAVVFFDDNNNLLVLSRDGITESLIFSPFARQMDQCLVYLDEAHTRGTDLKLPSDYRAAVTLGPDLTKDRLVQACMRMRKLGKGQSVMFCGPMEVELKILRCSGKPECSNIEVADVLQWSIAQTCIQTKRCVPLWATQGIRYQRRHIAWSDYSSNCGKESALKIAKSLLELEAQTVEDRYGFGGRRLEEQLLLSSLKDESLSKRETQLEAIRAKCREFKLASFDSATLREEQERELSPENEQERQVERPLPLSPHIHSVHRDLRLFIGQGILHRSSDAFKPAFQLFGETAAKEYLEAKAWPTHLLVTADFSRTVEASGNQPLDLFLRPVHWIVSRRHGNTVEAVVVSPWEAHELLPSIRQQNTVTLHVYSPRVSKSVRMLEDLSFCAIPAAPESLPNCPLILQLNIFAGQLYLRSYDEYLALCRLLGLCFGPPPEQIEVGCDGFISPLCRPEYDEIMAEQCPFKISPIEFLRMVIAMRRKGQNSQKSHIGRILQGELLAKEQFI